MLAVEVAILRKYVRASFSCDMWSSAAMKRMGGESIRTFGIDRIPELVELSRSNIMKDDGSLLAGITLETRDGWKGAIEHGPFDAIHVGAAAEEMPEDLIKQ